MPAQTAPKRNGILSQYLGLPKQVYLLVFSKMICACGYFVYPYITLYLSQVMGYGTDTIGWCSFAFAMCYVPAALIGGKFSDKFSRKKTYLIYMILGDVFLCLTGILTGKPILIVTLVFFYFFDNSLAPLYNSVVMDITTPDNRQEAYSLGTLVLNIGFSIAQVLAGLFFLKKPNWIFFGMAFFNLIAVVLLFLFLKETKKKTVLEEGGSEADVEQSLRNDLAKDATAAVDVNEPFLHVLKKRPLLIFFSIACALLTFIYALYMYMIPLHMQDLFGAEEGTRWYSILCTVNGIAIIVLTPFLILMTKKQSPVFNMAVCGLVYLIGFGAYIFVKSPFLFVLFSPIWSCGETLYFANNPTFVSNYAPVTHRARFQSFVDVVAKLGSATGPLIMGAYLVSHSFTSAWTVVAIISAAAIVIFLTLRLLEKRQRSVA
jgi:predicted MFS family arabinose efflux permease